MRRFRDEDEVDLVVVGAGAGGSVLAQRLARRGWRIAMLEAAPFWDPDEDWVSDEAGSHALYWTEQRIIGGEDPVELGQNNSGRGVGGSMVHSAGYAPRFHPSDFETFTRDGVGADWPISYSIETPRLLLRSVSRRHPNARRRARPARPRDRAPGLHAVRQRPREHRLREEDDHRAAAGRGRDRHPHSPTAARFRPRARRTRRSRSWPSRPGSRTSSPVDGSHNVCYRALEPRARAPTPRAAPTGTGGESKGTSPGP
jgi:hypothetical protein